MLKEGVLVEGEERETGENGDIARGCCSDK